MKQVQDLKDNNRLTEEAGYQSMTEEMPDKPRLLVTISFSFSIRYIVRTGLLQRLAQFVTPVIVITWKEDELIKELERKGYEVHVLSLPKESSDYLNIRRKIDIWFRHFIIQRKYTKVQQNYLAQFVSKSEWLKKKTIEYANKVRFHIPAYRKGIFKRELDLLQSDQSFKEAIKMVRSLHVDAVFSVTPFHRQEDILLRACKQEGKQMITSILSFDNVTKRGWIPVEYDAYMVWNKYNKEELLGIYQHVKADAVKIVGAPQFDFYFKNTFVTNRKDWLKEHLINGIEERKIILYAGGPKSLFPNEPVYLKHIYEAIKTGKIEGNPVLFFRCHPMDNIERWKAVLPADNEVVFDTSWTGAVKSQNVNITEDDIRKLCSTLAHTDVHINLCSTMSIDGSAFFKPQIGPAYDAVNPSRSGLLKAMYYQKHFQPVMFSDAIRLAESRQDLVDLINKALLQPEEFCTNANKVLDEIISFRDGASTERVSSFIEEMIMKTSKQ